MPRRLAALLFAILALSFALWQNRAGYALWPNLLALAGILAVYLTYKKR